MPTGAVTAATAHQGMIAEAIHDSIATRAFMILFSKRYAQPAAEHSYVQRRLVVELSLLAGSGVEEQTCAAGRDRLKWARRAWEVEWEVVSRALVLVSTALVL